MIASYPRVLGEVQTLQRVVAGESLCRYGDGEFKMCNGAGIKSQSAHPVLRRRLTEILARSGDCLVGIPNILSETPKPYWKSFLTRGAQLLHKRAYVSSFITRPDSAPWIDTGDYWELLESLWVGREVTLVRGSSKSLVAEDLVGAARVNEIVCPPQHAFSDYGAILKRIGTPERALLCLGPSATVLSVDLCARGVHAIDLGHVGMFLRKRRRGEPMWVTDAEKAVDREMSV